MHVLLELTWQSRDPSILVPIGPKWTAAKVVKYSRLPKRGEFIYGRDIPHRTTAAIMASAMVFPGTVSKALGGVEFEAWIGARINIPDDMHAGMNQDYIGSMLLQAKWAVSNSEKPWWDIDKTDLWDPNP